MANLQIKGMDDDLYEALRARASFDNRSISQEVITIIQEFLCAKYKSNEQKTEELLALAGSWEDERSAEEIIKDIRKSRKSKEWRNIF